MPASEKNRERAEQIVANALIGSAGSEEDLNQTVSDLGTLANTISDPEWTAIFAEQIEKIGQGLDMIDKFQAEQEGNA